jgi:hypothetical protein
MKSTILKRTIICINLHDAVVVTDDTDDSDVDVDFVDSDVDSDVKEIIEVDALFSKISSFFKVDLSFFVRYRYQTLASFFKAFELFIRRSYN